MLTLTCEPRRDMLAGVPELLLLVSLASALRAAVRSLPAPNPYAWNELLPCCGVPPEDDDGESL